MTEPQHPTIGRRVWYWPASLDQRSPNDREQPFDAGVVFVFNNGSEPRVNLSVTDHNGHQFIVAGVPVLNARAPGCAQWMPYQQAQHAKADARVAGELAPASQPHKKSGTDVTQVFKVGDYPPEPMPRRNFGYALEALKAGRRACRVGWNGKGLWLELQRPDAHSKMTLPYVFMCYPDDAQNTPGARVPWLASQTDMLADDWIVFAGDAA